MIVPATRAKPLQPVWWDPAAGLHGALMLIDQTRLPTDLVHVACDSAKVVWNAIKTLQVRGAPAIGVAAAYGVIVALDENKPNEQNWRDLTRKACDYLGT